MQIRARIVMSGGALDRAGHVLASVCATPLFYPVVKLSVLGQNKEGS